MGKKESKDMALDPRTFLLLLVFANVITFFQNSIWIELGWICFLGLMMLLSGKYAISVQWLLSFGSLLLLQYILLPAAPKAVVTVLFTLVNYSRRMFPCLMVGIFIRCLCGLIKEQQGKVLLDGKEMSAGREPSGSSNKKEQIKHKYVFLCSDLNRI